ncbi:MAG: stage III sporulation protein AD [Clostridiales bacterium]|nr:stage III sporulation protein AD [Clostridiales bacterium]
MDIFQIVAIGIVASVIAIVIKEYKPELAIQISIVTGLIIFIAVLNKLSLVLTVLKFYSVKAEIDIMYFSIILKVISIAYVTEFGAQICKDSGEISIGNKVEFAGKVAIMVLAIPIYAALFDIIIKIMP